MSVIGSTFLSTTIAVAAGAFPSEGRWIENDNAGNAGGLKENELVFEGIVRRSASASSLTGDWEIQNLALPQGWKCKSNGPVADLVEALVPADCFRFESSLAMPKDPIVLEKWQNEVNIAEDSTSWTCGAKCGSGRNDGLALYPKRFFVNVTSHIEWFLSRGVDITVIYAMRDHSISMKERLKDDCPILEVAEKEDAMAMAIMKEAYEKYGKQGSHLKNGNERVIVVSYEGLLEFKEVYLFDLYHQLGMNSTYAPAFIDENAKYVTDPMMKAALKTSSMQH